MVARKWATSIEFGYASDNWICKIKKGFCKRSRTHTRSVKSVATFLKWFSKMKLFEVIFFCFALFRRKERKKKHTHQRKAAKELKSTCSYDYIYWCTMMHTRLHLLMHTLDSFARLFVFFFSIFFPFSVRFLSYYSSSFANPWAKRSRNLHVRIQNDTC